MYYEYIMHATAQNNPDRAVAGDECGGDWLRNPGADHDVLARAIARTFPSGSLAAARAEIRSWPDYEATPLVSLVDEAAAARVATLQVKLERERFGAGSFKMLGGAFAVFRHARTRATRHTYVCGSAGNHGLSVAWAARRAGCPAVVFVPGQTRAARKERIRAQGAELRIVDGDYEVALARASEAAAAGCVLVSDFSDRDDPLTSDVMRGYTIIADEIRAGGAAPTHLFVPAGVGGLAAALVADYGADSADDRPRIIAVEPVGAACVLESLRAGRRMRLPSLETRLAPLACRTPSAPAWPLLRAGVDAAVTVTDDEVSAAAEALGTGPEVEPDQCGATALAGVRRLASNPAARKPLGLTLQSRVLVLVTE